MESFANFFRGLGPYMVYFEIGKYLSFAGFLYMVAARLNLINFKSIRQPLLTTEAAIKVWIVKNIPYVIFLSLGLIFGTSIVGCLSNLLLLINVTIAYNYYPRNKLVYLGMTHSEIARQFLRNVFLAGYLSIWNTLFQRDSEHFRTEEIFIMAFGCLVFFSGMYFKVHYDSHVYPFVTSEITVPIAGEMFDLVTGPNELATLVMWFGYHIVSGNHISMYFFFYKAQVAIGKAIARHIWYEENYPDYSQDRQIIFPYLY